MMRLDAYDNIDTSKTSHHYAGVYGNTQETLDRLATLAHATTLIDPQEINDVLSGKSKCQIQLLGYGSCAPSEGADFNSMIHRPSIAYYTTTLWPDNLLASHIRNSLVGTGLVDASGKRNLVMDATLDVFNAKTMRHPIYDAEFSISGDVGLIPFSSLSIYGPRYYPLTKGTHVEKLVTAVPLATSMLNYLTITRIHA